jgi:AcrR family transcriptional regulator
MTGITGSRAQRIADTKKRVADAALDLFVAHGFVATTVEQICAAGDISRASFFRYFDNKEAVLSAEIEPTQEWLLEQIRSRPAGEPPIATIVAVCTAHADKHLVGPGVKAIDCGVPINNGAMHIVAKAALRALTTWMTTGKAPDPAPRIDVEPGASPQIRRNADGIALGGIRTPPVDVPVATLSGVPGPNPSTICLLLGSTKPFSAARLAQLYPSRAQYRKRYQAHVSSTIKAGFALPGDRAALLAFAEPSQIKG